MLKNMGLPIPSRPYASIKINGDEEKNIKTGKVEGSVCLDSPAKNAQPGCDLHKHTHSSHTIFQASLSLSHLHTLIAW